MPEETLKKPIWISLDDLADSFVAKLYKLDSDEVDCMTFRDTDELKAEFRKVLDEVIASCDIIDLRAVYADLDSRTGGDGHD